jgi:hypothetical protein
MKTTTDETKYWNPYVAGVLLGVVLFFPSSLPVMGWGRPVA